MDLVAQRRVGTRILLVTSNYHTRRARIHFPQKIFPRMFLSRLARLRIPATIQTVGGETAPALKIFFFRKCGLLLHNVGVAGGRAAAQPSASILGHVVWDGALGWSAPVMPSKSHSTQCAILFSLHPIRHGLYFLPRSNWPSPARGPPAHTGGFHVAKARTAQIFLPGRRSCCRFSGRHAE